MKRWSKLSGTWLLATTVLFFGCRKDNPQPEPRPQPPPPPQEDRVFVLNEGAFGSGKGTVSLYNPATQGVTEDYYAQQNPGGALGDVVHAMIRHKDEYFVVVNNSGRIVVCDVDFRKKGEIAGLASPRYILPIGGDLAYVSDFKSGSVAVVNLVSRSIVQQVALPGFSEGMVLHNGLVYVTNPSRSYLYKVDPAQHKVIDSIDVGPGGSGVVYDENGKLWVLGGGDYITGTPGRLSRINPQSWTVELSLPFAQDAYASELCLSPGRDTLYYLDNGIRRMKVSDAQLPAAPWIAAGTRAFYALEVNPETHQLFVSDVIDYTQKSSVHVFGSDGQERAMFKAGVIATDFYFE